MKETKKTYRREIKFFWYVFFFGLFSFVGVFVAAGFGLFGKMPEFRQLENPKTNLDLFLGFLTVGIQAFCRTNQTQQLQIPQQKRKDQRKTHTKRILFRDDKFF